MPFAWMNRRAKRPKEPPEPPPLPPGELERRTAEIRAEWSEAEHRARAPHLVAPRWETPTAKEAR